MHKAFCTMSTETFLNWLWPGWTATLFLCYCWASLMNLQSPTSRAEFLKRTGKCQSSRLIPAAVEHVQQACGCVMFDWLNTSALCRGHRSNQVRFWWSLKSPIICQSNEKFVTFHFERHFLFCCKCLRGFSFVQSRNYVQTSEVLISRWGTWGFSALDYCRPLSDVLNLANMFAVNVMTNILQTVVESWHLHCYPVNGWLSFSWFTPSNSPKFASQVVVFTWTSLCCAVSGSEWHHQQRLAHVCFILTFWLHSCTNGMMWRHMLSDELPTCAGWTSPFTLCQQGLALWTGISGVRQWMET